MPNGHFAKVQFQLTQEPPISVAPGGAFDLNVSVVTDTEQIAGAGYWLEVDAAGSGLFSITARDIAGSPFTDLMTPDATLLDSANALLDPRNNNDIGAFEPSFVLQGPGQLFFATLTIASDAAAAPGDYTFSIANFEVVDDFGDPMAATGNSASVTLVPEPATVVLLGLCSLAALRRRRA